MHWCRRGSLSLPRRALGASRARGRPAHVGEPCRGLLCEKRAQALLDERRLGYARVRFNDLFEQSLVHVQRHTHGMHEYILMVCTRGGKPRRGYRQRHLIDGRQSRRARRIARVRSTGLQYRPRHRLRLGDRFGRGGYRADKRGRKCFGLQRGTRFGFFGLDPLGASCLKEHRASRLLAHRLGSVCGARLRR